MKKSFFKILIILMLVAYPIYNAISLPSVNGTAVSTSSDATVDLSMLKELESQDAAKVEKAIEKKDKKNKDKSKESKLKKERKSNINALIKQVEEGKTSYRKILRNTVIVGDSLMHGMNEYKVLDEALLVTKVSASLKHFEANMDTIVKLNPKVVVLHYGLNNMSTNEQSITNFVTVYTKLLKQLNKELPDARIVVSSVFNVAPSVAKGDYADIAHFNSRLQKMCKDNGFEYLDNSALLPGDGKYLEPDGIHVVKKFYTEAYLPNLIVSLGL